MSPKGLWWPYGDKTVRQCVPDLGGGNRKSSAADGRESEGWYNETVGDIRLLTGVMLRINDWQQWPLLKSNKRFPMYPSKRVIRKSTCCSRVNAMTVQHSVFHNPVRHIDVVDGVAACEWKASVQSLWHSHKHCQSMWHAVHCLRRLWAGSACRTWHSFLVLSVHAELPWTLCTSLVGHPCSRHGCHHTATAKQLSACGSGTAGTVNLGTGFARDCTLSGRCLSGKPEVPFTIECTCWKVFQQALKSCWEQFFPFSVC